MNKTSTEYRAGGVVFRREQGQLQFLLVTSNSNKNRWVIPAGHIEAGETAAAAATREVFEEAGVETEIINHLGKLQYLWLRNNQRLNIETELYLMSYLKTLTENPEGRLVKFFSFEEIMDLIIWEESREFIEKANKIANNWVDQAGMFGFFNS